MNEIVNKFLLAGDKLMPEVHLKQLRFTSSACEPSTKNKERIQKFKETGDTSYIYKNELDKAYFQHDMACGDFKDLKRRTFSDKVLEIKHLILLKILNMMDIKEKRKVYSGFRDNIWAADLADMQLISKFNKRFRFGLFL